MELGEFKETQGRMLYQSAINVLNRTKTLNYTEDAIIFGPIWLAWAVSQAAR